MLTSQCCQFLFKQTNTDLLVEIANKRFKSYSAAIKKENLLIKNTFLITSCTVIWIKLSVKAANISADFLI